MKSSCVTPPKHSHLLVTMTSWRTVTATLSLMWRKMILAIAMSWNFQGVRETFYDYQQSNSWMVNILHLWSLLMGYKMGKRGRFLNIIELLSFGPIKPVSLTCIVLDPRQKWPFLVRSGVKKAYLNVDHQFENHEMNNLQYLNLCIPFIRSII